MQPKRFGHHVSFYEDEGTPDIVKGCETDGTVVWEGFAAAFATVRHELARNGSYRAA